jgi:5-methylcytosine-specific restriction protein A
MCKAGRHLSDKNTKEGMSQAERSDKGRITPAVLVDHIIPVEERPDLRLVEDNLQSLCRPCHDKKHAKR